MALSALTTRLSLMRWDQLTSFSGMHIVWALKTVGGSVSCGPDSVFAQFSSPFPPQARSGMDQTNIKSGGGCVCNTSSVLSMQGVGWGEENCAHCKLSGRDLPASGLTAHSLSVGCVRDMWRILRSMSCLIWEYSEGWLTAPVWAVTRRP